MQATNNKKAKSNKALYFILLIAIFVAPMLAAWLMYSTNRFIPESVTHGQLIDPPLELKNLTLIPGSKNILKSWIILYINPHQCEQSCQDVLYKIRQIRTALGKEAPRIDRLILTVSEQGTPQLDNWLNTKYSGTDHRITTLQDLSQFLEPLPSKALALTEGAIFLVDPLGNIMLSYPPDTKPKGIYTDLKRLLKISQIG